MPVNMLRKDTPKGEKPPGWTGGDLMAELKSSPDQIKEAELAAQEQEALWESQEVGLTKWSGQDGKRYGD